MRQQQKSWFRNGRYDIQRGCKNWRRIEGGATKKESANKEEEEREKRKLVKKVEAETKKVEKLEA